MAKAGKGRARTAEERILAAVVADTERRDKMQDRMVGNKGDGEEEVWIKGTGRAIEKVLGLAEFFRRSGDVRVRLRTGSVWAVDDVLREHRGELQEEEQVQEGAESEIPDSRLRQTSMLEVGVSSA
jgi:ribonuclease P/MRP protein subunit POP7